MVAETNSVNFVLRITPSLHKAKEKLIYKKHLDKKILPNALRYALELMVTELEQGIKSETHSLIYQRYMEAYKEDGTGSEPILPLKNTFVSSNPETQKPSEELSPETKPITNPEIQVEVTPQGPEEDDEYG